MGIRLVALKPSPPLQLESFFRGMENHRAAPEGGGCSTTMIERAAVTVAWRGGRRGREEATSTTVQARAMTSLCGGYHFMRDGFYYLSLLSSLLHLTICPY
uniref:Uncharacterized protein n=1 Tax=Oryza sativa subsp. japonica TaxID=39947 RepID=Q7XHM9_ORYSJ|nr:hypothetical protein [Oryza sativa Japonica Group]BAD31206.1 hypothetical protein [Oryza sativa Japonica Group]